jgi:hypothetical protein
MKFFLFSMEQGLNSRLHAFKEGTVPFEPHLQPVFLWLFGDGVSRTIGLSCLKDDLLI